MRLQWWNGVDNFGDLLSAWLLRNLYDQEVTHHGWASADMVMAGSLLQLMPADFSGIVLGTGCIHDGYFPLPDADVRAVRGFYSARAVRRSKLTLGDPGILLARTAIQPGERRYQRHVFIPHFADPRTQHDGVEASRCVHSVGDTLLTIINAGDVTSSSLHVLIAADALGVTHRWSPAPQVIGDGWKFHDYVSAFNEDRMSPGQWRLTPRSLMAERVKALDAALRLAL